MSVVAHLWLPILLSAAAVFVLSAASHMALPWRRNEWGRITDFAALQDALAQLARLVGDFTDVLPLPWQTLSEGLISARGRWPSRLVPWRRGRPRQHRTLSCLTRRRFGPTPWRARTRPGRRTRCRS